MNPVCTKHHHVASMHCVSCSVALCPDCDRYDVNARPWCISCGKRHDRSLPTALAIISAKLALVAAVFVVVTVVLSTFMRVPLLLPSAAAVAVAWRVFFVSSMTVTLVRAGRIVKYAR